MEMLSATTKMDIGDPSRSPTTVSDALVAHSPLFVTPDLDGWLGPPSSHASHNGLLVQRPFLGQWDAYQADIDAADARECLEMGIIAQVKVSDNFANELQAAIGGILTRAALPPLLSKQIFSDACHIGRALAAMTCTSAGVLEVKLEVAGANICKRWHQDNFVGRALTSYTGVVGTEFTRDENVDFWELNNCGNNDCILRNKDDVETIDVGDIIFMKGKLYPGGKALVHRSPAQRFLPDGRVLNRLMLKLDIPTRSDGLW